MLIFVIFAAYFASNNKHKKHKKHYNNEKTVFNYLIINDLRCDERTSH